MLYYPNKKRSLYFSLYHELTPVQMYPLAVRESKVKRKRKEVVWENFILLLIMFTQKWRFLFIFFPLNSSGLPVCINIVNMLFSTLKKKNYLPTPGLSCGMQNP